MEQRDHMICIVGPTASGKTALSVRLAQALGGRDRFVRLHAGLPPHGYRHGKAHAEERCGVPHHMLDVADRRRITPSAAMCRGGCLRAGHPVTREAVILVGGTGLYIDSLIAGRQFAPLPQTGRREALERRAAEEGAQPLLDELRAVDSEPGGAAVRLGRKAHRPRAGDLAGDRQDHDGLRPGEPGDPAALPAAVARPALPGARAALCPHRSARGADVCAGTCARRSARCLTAACGPGDEPAGHRL